MPYANDSSPLKPIEIFNAINKRLFKSVGKWFPLNFVRVWSFRRCGYQIGSQVYIGEELQITDYLEVSHHRLTIGDRVSIAQRVTIILDSDPNWSRLASRIAPIHGRVHIHEDAWIGSGAILLPNINIGEQAIVGAGSIVTKDVPAFTVVAGNPARIIKRFNNSS